jgi:hypothetical protein
VVADCLRHPPSVPAQAIPTLEVPLHTLIELTPRPDGTMHVRGVILQKSMESTDICSHISVGRVILAWLHAVRV